MRYSLNANKNDEILSTHAYLYRLPLISYFTCLACVLSHRIVGRIKQDKACGQPNLVFASPGKISHPSPHPRNKEVSP